MDHRFKISHEIQEKKNKSKDVIHKKKNHEKLKSRTLVTIGSLREYLTLA